MGAMPTPTTLVTGGCGFLGSHFVRSLVAAGSPVLNMDLLTYAGSTARLSDLEAKPGYRFLRADVADVDAVRRALADLRPHAVVHFAAESHVTRSERDPERFHRTNVEGTRVLLEEAERAGAGRFVHISTDEVYGPITEGAFREEDKRPGDAQATSPYARSKALADDLALGHQGELEVVVVRPTNAFGPWQFPEKALPRWITRGLRGRPLLVWGDGLYVRQWLFAEDLAGAVRLVLQAGSPERAYNIGPRHDPEITNLDLARWLCDHLGLHADRVVMTEYDRPDHDRRYAVDASRIEALGWKPADPWSRFAETVAWYRANEAWWQPLIEEAESIYADGRAAR